MKKILLLIILTLSFTSLFAETIYYPDGHIKQEDNFINGTGSYKLYDENGNLEQTGTYKNGKLEGSPIVYYTNYYPDSNIIKETGSYKDGKEYGTITTYYKNGQIHYKMEYKYGERNGLSIGYYENGALYEKGSFIDNKPNGKSYRYFKNGSIQAISDLNGTPIYDSNGSINLLKTKLFGNVTGSVTQYSQDGSIKKVYKF
jgi:antitoxin component YwqK of YwqJK toxin-antitoxin module